MKKIPRKLVWTLGIFLGLILVTVLGLRLFFPAEKVQEMAVNLASEKLGRPVAVTEAGLSFSGGLGVKLGGVEIANPAGFEGEPLLTAEKIDLKLQLAPLFKGQFQINRLVVDQPRVRLHRLATGADNFTFDNLEEGPAGAAEAGAKDTGSDLAVSIDRVEIHRGLLAYTDEGTGQGVDLIGLDLSGSLTNPGPGIFRSAGKAAVDSLRVEGDQPLPTVAAEVEYDLAFDTSSRMLTLDRGDGRVAGLPLGLTGRLTAVPDSLRMSGQVRSAGISLDDLRQFLTPEQLETLEPITFAGQVAVEADLEFDQARAEPMAYKGSATITDLSATSRDVAGELKVRETRLDFRPDQVKVATDGGSFDGQPLELQLTVADFENPRVDGKFSGDIDLAFAEPFLPPERQAALAGRCRLESTFSGPAQDAEAMAYSGRAVLQDVSYHEAALPDTLHQLNGTFIFSPDSVVVDQAEARFGAGDLTLSGVLTDHLPYFLPSHKDQRDNLKKPTFTFAARSRRIDIDKLFPAAAPGASGVSATAGTATDSIAAESIPDILSRGTIQADTLIYSQVPFTEVVGKVNLKDRVLEVYDVSGGVYGGQAGGRVTVDLNDLNDPGYAGEFEAADIEANNFLTRFAALGGAVFGQASLGGKFSARGRDPEIIRNTLTMDSEAALTSGKIMTGDFLTAGLGPLATAAGQQLDREQTLKDLVTLIKVDAGRVSLDEFQTRLGRFGDLTLGGSYSFAGDLNYEGSLLLTKEETDRLYATGGLVGAVANLFVNQAERLRLPLTVSGTRDKPRMALDFTELTDNLRSQAEDDLKDEISDRLKGLFGK